MSLPGWGIIEFLILSWGRVFYTMIVGFCPLGVVSRGLPSGGGGGGGGGGFGGRGWFWMKLIHEDDAVRRYLAVTPSTKGGGGEGGVGLS